MPHYDTYKLPKKDDPTYYPNGLQVEQERERNTKKQSCMTRTASSSVCEFIFWLLITIYGILTLIAEWVLFHDAYVFVPSLVYGPPRWEVVVALVVIASLSSLIFFFEFFVGAARQCTDVPISVDLVTALGIFFMEVPQTTILWNMSLCREAPLGYYHLAKAAVAFLAVVLRPLTMLFNFFNIKYKDTRGSCINCCFRLFVVLCCLYVCAGSIMVFIFTFVTPAQESSLPPTPNEAANTWHAAKYLNKTGVYLQHPSICNDSSAWLHLGNTYDLMAGVSSSASLYFADNKTLIYVNNTLGSNCFYFEQDNCKSQNCSGNTIDNATEFTINLWYEPPDQIALIGDIKFSAYTIANDECRLIQSDQWGRIQEPNEGMLQYFQFNSDNFSGTEMGLYNSSSELKNITEVWKTGYHKCQSTGALAPTRDTDLQACVRSQGLWQVVDIYSI